MELPREIIEKILLFCDGPTLCSALHVSKEWENIVEYLTQLLSCYFWKKYNIWRELLHKEVAEYGLCFYNTSEWKHIYINHLAWMNKPPSEFENKEFEVDQPLTQITSVAVCGNYVALAIESGKILLYYKNELMWDNFHHLQYQDIALHFITGKTAVPIGLIMVSGGMPTICILNGKYPVHQISDELLFVKLDIYTVSRNYLVELKLGSICVYEFDALLCANYFGPRSKIFTRRYLNIYVRVPMYLKMVSERKLVVMGLYEHILLEMQVLNTLESSLEPYIIVRGIWPTSLNTMINWRKLSLCMLNELDYIVCYNDPSAEIQTQLFSIHLGHSYKKTLFPQKVYGALVTCIYLYGSTLVIGTIDSWLYFYLIKDKENWNKFQLENYYTSCNMGPTFCGIKSIQAIDLDGRRDFYIHGGNDNIRLLSVKLSITNCDDEIDLK